MWWLKTKLNTHKNTFYLAPITSSIKVGIPRSKCVIFLVDFSLCLFNKEKESGAQTQKERRHRTITFRDEYRRTPLFVQQVKKAENRWKIIISAMFRKSFCWWSNHRRSVKLYSGGQFHGNKYAWKGREESKRQHTLFEDKDKCSQVPQELKWNTEDEIVK